MTTAAFNRATSCQVDTPSFGKTDVIKPAGDPLEITAIISNPESAHDPIDIEVSIENLPDEFTIWSVHSPPVASDRTPYRLALFPGESEEVTFAIKADSAAPPRLVNYQIIVRQATQDISLNAVPLKLRILPVNRSEVSIDNPTFSFEPPATLDKPLKIPPLAGLIPIQVWVDNHSERVDSFQLRCEGLPKDWDYSIEYPQMALGTGLMLPATGLGLTPRAQGHIQLIIKPSPTAHAGIYTPTLQVISANNPALRLLHLLYLEISPLYQLQPSLNTLHSQFRRGPGRFELQLVNSGNTPRQLSIEVESLEETARHRYRLNSRQRSGQFTQTTDRLADNPQQDNSKEKEITQIDLRVLPQQTRFVELDVQPKRRWRRPMFGGGYLSNFRLNIVDADDHALATATFQGNTTWMARPWWQLLLAVLLVLGLLGSAAGLIWWFFLRPPAVLSLKSTKSEYSAITEEFATVDFKLRYAEGIQAIHLTGYDLDGKVVSAPITYSFQDLAQQNKMRRDALPQGLNSLCSVQPQRRLLTCGRVHTGASVPGDYVFQLDVVYSHRGEEKTLSEQTMPVAIAPIPGPTLTVNSGLAFQEPIIGVQPTTASDQPTTTASLETFPAEGLSLTLEAFRLQAYETITLTGKTGDGKTFAEKRYTISIDNQKPTLQRQTLEGKNVGNPVECTLSKIGQKSICDNILTEIQTVGAFQLEATLNPIDSAASTAVTTAITDPIVIEPSQSRITAFQLAASGNSTAPVASTISETTKSAHYVFFIDPAKFVPANPPRAIVEWQVTGGDSMQVTLLLPEPVTIGENYRAGGKYAVPLMPNENKTIVLQVTDANGNQTTESITIEVVGPPLPTPSEIAAQTGQALADALAENDENAAAAQREEASDQTEANQPAELPPQFN